MSHDHTERHLVEEPALALLRELGWATAWDQVVLTKLHPWGERRER